MSIPETTVARIRLGAPARVRFATLPGREIAGQVSEIGSAADKANAFRIKVALAESPPGVQPGMTAEAILSLSEQARSAGFLLPPAAILPSDTPRQGYVFIFDAQSSTVRRRKIQVGAVKDNMAVIIAGLKAGDVVATAGVSFLSDGQEVKLMARP